MGVISVGIALGRFVDPSAKPYIARLQIDQLIINDRDRLKALEALLDNSNIKALMVNINSPGGTVVGGEALHHALIKVSEKIPVVAVMGDLATSAGYMIAIATDWIVARKATITGSIGVLYQTAEITELLSKLGITVEAIKSSPLKAEPSPVTKLTPKVRRVTQRLVDDIYNMFVSMVAKNRNMKQSVASSLADGRVFTGRMALKAGLIAAIGGESEALNWLEEKNGLSANLPIREIEIKREGQDRFDRFSIMARKTVFSERLTLDGLVSVWHPRLQ